MNIGAVLPLIICREPRGKFFAKLSSKESGKKVGKENSNNEFVQTKRLSLRESCQQS